MKVKEFRLLTTEDKHDSKYDFAQPPIHRRPWSRVYEYPLVLDTLKAVCTTDTKIHNSSWGFGGVHITFKEELEKQFSVNSVENSDIRDSDLQNTFVYDITSPPPLEMVEKYDAVINISTVEEVSHDHVQVFQNLYKQVKKGGHVIITFDLPGLQIERFEKMLGLPLEKSGFLLSGKTSVVKDSHHHGLNVGILVVEKDTTGNEG